MNMSRWKGDCQTLKFMVLNKARRRKFIKNDLYADRTDLLGGDQNLTGGG